MCILHLLDRLVVSYATKMSTSKDFRGLSNRFMEDTWKMYLNLIH